MNVFKNGLILVLGIAIGFAFAAVYRPGTANAAVFSAPTFVEAGKSYICYGIGEFKVTEFADGSWAKVVNEGGQVGYINLGAITNLYPK